MSKFLLLSTLFMVLVLSIGPIDEAHARRHLRGGRPCVDFRESRVCGYYRSLGWCNRDFIREKYCPLTCGACSGQPDLCVDKRSSCQFYALRGLCKWVREDCKKTCGYYRSLGWCNRDF